MACWICTRCAVLGAMGVRTSPGFICTPYEVQGHSQAAREEPEAECRAHSLPKFRDSKDNPPLELHLAAYVRRGAWAWTSGLKGTVPL